MKVKLGVEGMHCGACAMHVDDALEDLEGVHSSKTSFARARVKVDYDPERVSAEQLREAIVAAGYGVGAS